MPQLFPFRGTRYAGVADVTAVSAPPYDVIDDDEQIELERADPHNAVRLILPHDTDTLDRYSAAAATLRDWFEGGVLAEDPEAHLYGYRMTFEDADGHRRTTHGVIGALELPPTGAYGDVLPHERTLPKARSDRLSLLRATRANFDPIWVLSLSPGLTDAIGAPVATESARGEDGTLHEISPLDAATSAAVAEKLATSAAVLADGHHRFETACAYRDEHPDDPAAGRIMTLAVELAEEQLWVQPIHRIVSGAPDLRARLHETFDIEPIGPLSPDAADELTHRMQATDGLGLLDAAGAAVLTARDPGAADAAMAEVPEPIRGVSSATFDALIRPLIPEATLSYRDNARTIATIVARDPSLCAVLLRPVSVPEIRAASLAGERMPEKTTFFAPKPRTGMVMRTFDQR